MYVFHDQVCVCAHNNMVSWLKTYQPLDIHLPFCCGAPVQVAEVTTEEYMEAL